MSFDPISAAFNLGNTLIEKLWPDPAKQAEEKRKLLEMQQQGNLAELQAHVELMTKQAEINLADAKSSRWFQANWRPAIGWVGALSLALMYIPKALVMTFIWSWQCYALLSAATDVSTITIPAFPDLGVSDIVGLLLSMLGVAGLRSYDKKNGIDTK